MSGRDRYQIKLQCRGCGKTGMADVSEADGRWISDHDFCVNAVPIGFHLDTLGKSSVDTLFKCSTCDVFVES